MSGRWIVGGPIGHQTKVDIAGVSVSERHDSTPPGSWLREQYERHRSEHPVEDAFDPGPSAYLRPVEERRAARDAFFRRLDEMLGREGVLEGLTAPVSDYVPQMARELYDDGA